MLLSLRVSAQTLDVTFNTSEYKGGYNISCYGASDGRLEAIIIGGTPPYSFQWSNGAFTKIIDGLTAGTYSITVTDSLHATVSKSYTLMGPDAMTGSLSVSTYNGGYNVSAQGADDGWIKTEIGGGAPPYTYQWSNGVEKENNHELTSGAYSVVVRDVNQCQLQLSASLTQPTPLHVVSITSPLHNGYNVSCKGGEDGAVNLTVSGGVPPYNFQWNNGNFTEDIQNLNAGVYSVKVKDANSVTVDASITLNQPGAIEVSLTAPTYPNGHHTTCYNCSNGSVTTTVTGGVMPYTYSWNTGQNTQNLSNLMAGTYSVLVTDANGCTKPDVKIDLTEPDRDDWTMTGNGGIDSSSEFLGTTDSTSLILKTNNAERIRIRGAGGVAIQSGLVVDSLNIQQNLSLGGRRLMGYRTSSQNGVGLFGFGQDPDESISSITSCSNPVLNVPTNYQFQGSLQLYGNFSAGSGIGVMEMGFDGTNSFIDVVGAPQTPNSNRLLVNYYCGRDAFICTGPNGGNVQLGGTNSNIGIGIDPSTIQVSNEFRLYVAHGIRTEKLRVDLQGNWPDYVFDTTYRLMKLHQLKEYINRNKRLPGIPSAFEIKNEGVDVGDMQCRLLTKIEELTLYLLEQQNEINELKKALSAKSSNK
ncbi:MAG: SprB repeat-containing protein [Bacteroidia bacterium]|nr:SprB repeat-containing protein [Bacteroidia bacterium]